MFTTRQRQIATPVQRRFLLIIVLVACAGRLASGQQLVVDEISAKFPAEALTLLTTVTPHLPEKLVLLTFEWPVGRLEPANEGGCWEPVEVRLTLALGPSVGNGTHVSNLLQRAAGTLWVGPDRRRWKIEQFNFGTFLARTGFEPDGKQVSFVLPVVFLSTPLDHDYEGGIHSVLGFSCKLNGQGPATCTGPHFVFQFPFAWEFFPEAPPLTQLLLPGPMRER